MGVVRAKAAGRLLRIVLGIGKDAGVGAGAGAGAGTGAGAGAGAALEAAVEVVGVAFAGGCEYGLECCCGACCAGKEAFGTDGNWNCWCWFDLGAGGPDIGG